MKVSISPTRSFLAQASLLLVLAGLIVGCSTPREFAKPVELTEIDNQIPPQIAWRADAGRDQKSKLANIAPVVVDDLVIVADPRGTVRAYKQESGDLIWRYELGFSLSAGGGAGDGVVVFGGERGEIVALSAADGQKLWAESINASIDTAPSVAFDRVLVRAKNGTARLLDLTDGKRRWRVAKTPPPLTLHGQSQAVMFSDAVGLGFDNGSFGVYDRTSGREIWNTQVAQPTGRTDVDRMVDIDANPVFADGVFYVGTYQGQLAALSAEGGRTLWSRDFSIYQDLNLDARAIYLVDESSVLWAIDRRSGETLWRQPDFMYRGLTAPALVGDYLLVGDYEGYVHLIERDTGLNLGRTGLGDRIVSPMAVADERVFAATRGGRLYAITLP
ncbi:MAG TPA: outer membrane protein assembly factor BamB [Halothiobacillaceae bacterium]|nr:outer membrane protein assembly factor BamB [Halothiobacillaceae bacterium]